MRPRTDIGTPGKPRFYGIHNIDKLPQFGLLSDDEQFALKVVGRVLPFRVNNYVVDELIDWSNVPDDPVFQLTFMQKEMLRATHFDKMADAVKRELPKADLDRIAREIRLDLNPHPAGQMTANVPRLEGEAVPGIQHKYRETCLVFPSNGQTCHAYCTFCFRWPQFVGMNDLKFATDESARFQQYIRQHTELTDVLFTGGDPMVMSARNIARYIEPLLEPEFEHIQSIRIGTKSLGYWPYRFVTDKDSDDIMRLFDKIVRSGKHLAIMAHFNHWQELATPAVHEAIRRVRSTGAQIRTQSPLIRNINDRSTVWARMWKEQVRLGCVPYYMFVERDTGSKHYFAVPLVDAWEIYQKAFQQVSGLARTVRGPSMSAFPGKVAVEGISEIRGERVFVLSFLQARNPDHVKRPFFARFDPNATWLSQLKPAFGRERFFFEQEKGTHRQHGVRQERRVMNLKLN
ncbi:MAG: lysine 2,3-aminomutase [Bacteroidetes bacterium]|nr:lysine 2,3-aminomutase [Bacteroidota bacterium]